MNLENYVFHSEKYFPYGSMFGLRKGPEYLYRLFNVLRKQTTYEMKTLQVYKLTLRLE